MLYEYLEKRFADTTVLTFQQLHDLLGVALPTRALTDPTWWSDTGTGASGTLWSDAWTLANKGEVEVGEHPNAMVLSRDGARLFVACANTNAVWVVDDDYADDQKNALYYFEAESEGAALVFHETRGVGQGAPQPAVASNKGA